MAQINLGRVKGDKGDKGDTPVVNATASVSNTTGQPSVSVSKRDTVDGAVFDFAFSNIKGEKGESGAPGAKGESPLAFEFNSGTGVLTITEK